MHRACRLALLPLLATALACAPPAEPPAEPTPTETAPAPLVLPAGTEAAEATITEEVLRAPIAELGDDRYDGRLPGSPGDTAARAWMAAQLEALGLEPGAPATDGGEASWEQPFDIVSLTTEAPERWAFQAADGSNVDLAWWEEYIAWIGVQEERATIENAELVFVGYGMQAPEYGWDDFADADLTGKVLLILNNDPDWDPDLFEGERRLYYGRWDYKYESAARQGAAGAIVIHTTPSAGYPWQVVQTSWTGPQLELPARADETRLQIASWTTWDAAARLAEAGGHDLAQLTEQAKSPEFTPVSLGLTTSIAVRADKETTRTANVLGLLRGSDPELADEVIIYTAHHDHLGHSADSSLDDPIYNGALDNAAGVSQVLAIAGAFRALPEPPRRSILIALVGAEEQGLLGSEYLAANPPVPPGRMAANLNFDGGNIWGRASEVVYVGYGKSSLDAVVEAAAARQDRGVVGDQFPDRGFFYRSDQFNLAKIGVPAIYLDVGTEFRGQPEGWGREQIEAWEAEIYHQPSDEIEEWWNFDGMVEDTRLGFICGLAIAQDNTFPTWNPGDEFEAARQQALADLAP